MRDWIPSARRNVFRQSGLRWKRDPNIIVDHTTEGGSFPSAAVYRFGLSAPHITTHPRARQTQQHYPFSRPAYALKAPGGLSTNTMGTIQVEIIGTCEDRYRDKPHSVYTFSDAELQYLADIHGEISDATGIPLTTSVIWKPYPASSGLSNGVRLGRDDFYKYRGVLGHQHVPGNTHGDPGDWIPKMLSLKNKPVVVPMPPEIWENNMIIIQNKDRGIALIGPGFYQGLTIDAANAYLRAGVKGPQHISAEDFDNIAGAARIANGG